MTIDECAKLTPAEFNEACRATFLPKRGFKFSAFIPTMSMTDAFACFRARRNDLRLDDAMIAVASDAVESEYNLGESAIWMMRHATPRQIATAALLATTRGHDAKTS